MARTKQLFGDASDRFVRTSYYHPYQFKDDLPFEAYSVPFDKTNTGSSLSATNTASAIYELETMFSGNYLPLSGGSMSGDIDMDSNNIFDVNELTFNNGSYINVGNNIFEIASSSNAMRIDSGNFLEITSRKILLSSTLTVYEDENTASSLLLNSNSNTLKAVKLNSLALSLPQNITDVLAVGVRYDNFSLQESYAIYSDKFMLADGFSGEYGKLVNNSLSSTRTWSFPDESGTVLLDNNVLSNIKYAETIVGDGSSTSFDVIHNKNTRDVDVTIYENSSPYRNVTFNYYIDHKVNKVVISMNNALANNKELRIVVI